MTKLIIIFYIMLMCGVPIAHCSSDSMSDSKAQQVLSGKIASQNYLLYSEAGWHFVNINDYDSAHRIFLKAYYLFPPNGEKENFYPALDLCYTLIMLKKYDEAGAILLGEVKHFYAEEKEYIRRVSLLYQAEGAQKKLVGALQKYLVCELTVEERLRTYEKLYDALEDQHDIAQRLKYMWKWFVLGKNILTPDDIPMLFYIAKSFYVEGNDEKGDAVLHACVELFPVVHENAFLFERYRLKNQQEQVSEDFHNSFFAYLKAQDPVPADDLQNAYFKAVTMMSRNRTVEERKQWLYDWLLNNLDHAISYVLLSNIFYEQEDMRQAQYYLEQARIRCISDSQRKMIEDKLAERVVLRSVPEPFNRRALLQKKEFLSSSDFYISALRPFIKDLVHLDSVYYSMYGAMVELEWLKEYVGNDTVSRVIPLMGDFIFCYYKGRRWVLFFYGVILLFFVAEWRYCCAKKK